ncbi:MAG TPA: flavin reductase family protein [Tepidiformaceae bacterium]|nr:flavin reductase family protein [Tepidiformaceae bacterium]
MSEVSPEEFKAALGSWASGVTVVTTELDGMVYGITVSSFSSLSMDPRLILVSLQDTNHLPGMIKQSRKFAVSILAYGQDEVSGYFATSGRDPAPGFDPGIPAVVGAIECPVFDGALATIECELEETIQGGDHTIAVGRVVSVRSNPEIQPLIYFRRAYRTVTGD